MFLLVTNKTFKSFKEFEFLSNEIKFETQDEIMPQVQKCFDRKDDIDRTNTSSINHKFYDFHKNYLKDQEYNEIKRNILKDKALLNAYKTFNSLLNKINKKNNFRIKVFYMDSYLNMLTPKYIIGEKLNQLLNYVKNQNSQIQAQNSQIQAQNDRIATLERIINENFPNKFHGVSK